MLMFDLSGPEISDDERELLRHPLIGGVILFAKNIVNAEQVLALTREIRAVRPELLIGVDQEGGRVQRLRKGYTRIPPMRALEKLSRIHRISIPQLLTDVGYLLASEVLASGIDFSFTPVLDVDHGVSQVIGDRAFAATVDEVIERAGYFIDGLHMGGCAAVGKHFPGHGAVFEDSHTEIPIDDRDWAFWQQEAKPFFALAKKLDAIMPAHIIIQKYDTLPVGFSAYWIQEILRKKIKFSGVVVTDDLSMKGAAIVGDMPERVRLAIGAGCDLILICHDRPGVIATLDSIQQPDRSETLERLRRLRARCERSWFGLRKDSRYQRIRKILLKNMEKVEGAL